MHRTRKPATRTTTTTTISVRRSLVNGNTKKNINGINGGAGAAIAAAGELFTSARDAYKSPYVAWPLV